MEFTTYSGSFQICDSCFNHVVNASLIHEA